MSTETLRDRLWLWGMKVNILQEQGTSEWGQSTMTTEDAIKKTGITNVLMAGGLPLSRETLDSMPSAERIIAKSCLHAHSEEKGFYLDYDSCVGALRDAKELAAADTRVESFLIDDFSTGTVDAGVKPEHLAQLQFLNAAELPHLPLCGTMYTMSLERPEVPALLPYFAAYMTPLWHAADIEALPGDVDRLAALSGGKPQLLCIYLYDFGNGQQLSYELMQRQLDVSRMLLRQDKVYGVVILGTCMMDLDWEANRCFYDWLEENGDEPLS